MMLDCLKGINFKKTGNFCSRCVIWDSRNQAIIKQRCKETLYKWNGSGA